MSRQEDYRKLHHRRASQAYEYDDHVPGEPYPPGMYTDYVWRLIQEERALWRTTFLRWLSDQMGMIRKLRLATHH